MLDLIVYGATGFTGTLAAQYLVTKSCKLGIAGRSLPKLEELHEKLLSINKNAKIEIICADSSDSESIDRMTAKTKVLVSTVGPYLLYGEPVGMTFKLILVKSCIKNGTHYVDITGETVFIQNILKYHNEAVEKGVKIVPSCGFDSLPGDLCAFLIADHFARKGLRTGLVQFTLMGAKGGVSGGTIATMDNMLRMPSKKLKEISDPYCICDKEHMPLKEERSFSPFLFYDKQLKKWVSYFFMEQANTRYVRRSASLLNYGLNFKYQEMVACSNLLLAIFSNLGFFIVAFLLWFSWVRRIVMKYRPSGQGPDLKQLEKGFFKSITYGHAAETEDKVKVLMHMRYDPGYFGTARMLSETALALALDSELIARSGTIKPLKGGILTASSAVGSHLAKRLHSTGFCDIKVEEI